MIELQPLLSLYSLTDDRMFYRKHRILLFLSHRDHLLRGLAVGHLSGGGGRLRPLAAVAARVGLRLPVVLTANTLNML